MRSKKNNDVVIILLSHGSNQINYENNTLLDPIL